MYNSMAIVIYNSLHIICLYLLSVAWFCNANNNNNGNGLKGMFIFGSSVVDNGNNNNVMLSLAKANYPPYGIDFVDGPTGRFSNGKNLADFICDYLQLPLIPAFADNNTKDDRILRGVNFASGGSGILDETGVVAGKVITLNQQIRNFENVTLPDLEGQLKRDSTEILPDYLFLLAAGNNDYLLNYFLLGQATQSPDAFAARLISTYSAQIKRLYKLGARKFVVISVYPLGCSPVVSRGQGCLARQNDIVSKFYDHLIPAINQIKTQLPASDFVVLNSVKVISDIINNPITSGLSNVSGSCCEVSINGLSCRQNGRVCNNRNEYAYFDGQHNTEALSAIVASNIYSSQHISEVYPLNLRQFLQAHGLN